MAKVYNIINKEGLKNYHYKYDIFSYYPKIMMTKNIEYSPSDLLKMRKDNKIRDYHGALINVYYGLNVCEINKEDINYEKE